MKNRNIWLLMMVVVVYCLNGCKQPTENAMGEKNGAKDYAEILAQADSLIDIAPDSTLILCREYFESNSSQADTLYAKAKLIEGNAYFSLGDMEEAVESMKSAREIAKKNSNEYVLINATTDLGVAKRVSQQPDSAMALYKEALGMIGEGEYKEEKAHLLTSIAILYANTGHLDEARDYADKAVDASKESKDMDMIMYATSQAGAIYNLLGNVDKGFQLAHEALTNAQKLQLPRYEIKTLGHMIDMHLKVGNKDSVMYYLKRGEQLSRQFPENSVEGLGFLEEKHVVLASLGRNRESIDVQRHLLNLQNKAAAFMPAEKLWLRMARNYSALHEQDSARICYEKAIEDMDSIRGAETDKQLNEFYARYKTTEKELALANMERKKAETEKWLVMCVAIAVLAVIMSVLYIRGRKKQERVRILRSRINGIEEERRRLAKELHDGVCNDLYGIEMLLQADRPNEELLEDVERIRMEARRISHELMPPALEDVNMAQALEEMVSKLRHAYPEKTFSLSITPNGGWDKVSDNVTYSLYRICQELIGNILRHANPENVSLAISRKANELKVELSHDGAESINNQGTGIGVASVKERLSAIGARAEGLPYAPIMTITCKLR